MRCYEKWVCKIEKVNSYAKIDEMFCMSWYECLAKGG